MVFMGQMQKVDKVASKMQEKVRKIAKISRNIKNLLKMLDIFIKIAFSNLNFVLREWLKLRAIA